MDLFTLGAGHLRQIGAGRALAVGPGDMDGRGQAVLRIAQGRQQALEPTQGEVNFLGMQAREARQRVVNILAARANGHPRRRPHDQQAAVSGWRERKIPDVSS